MFTVQSGGGKQMSDADDARKKARKKAIEESGFDVERFMNKALTYGYALKGIDYEERKKQCEQISRRELMEVLRPVLDEIFGSEFTTYKPKEEGGQ
jgi:hypothetical protein